jgi:NitT/TauT family transport system permease protein
MSFETDVALNALPSVVPAPARRKTDRKISLRKPPMWLRYGVRLLAVAIAIALWQMASTSQFHLGVNFENVPSPTAVWREFAVLLHTKRFYIDLYVSIERIVIAFALASVSGILIGIVMGRFWLIEDLVSPYIEILRPIPAVAWIPIAILIMPTEESSIVFITFLGAFYPIVLNTVHGVAQTPAVLIRAARSLGASNRTILFRVILPSALPNIMTGLAVGMGIAWFSLLAGEIISGQYGIGYFTWASYTLVQYPKIIIGMLCIGVLGTASTSLVRLLAKPFLHWQADGNPRH